MLRFLIDAEANGSAQNDYFLVLLPCHDDHQPGATAEVWDSPGHHILGFAEISARSHCRLADLPDSVALPATAMKAAECKQQLANTYKIDSNDNIDIICLHWQERNVEAFEILQTISWIHAKDAHPQPSPALISKIQSVQHA